MNDEPLLEKFQNGNIVVSEFGHREHVQAAWEMLKVYPFLEASTRYARCIENLARSAGAPEKFNLTITLAFMSLIAEKIAGNPGANFDEFYNTHPELKKNPIKNWYSDQRLNSDLARKVFLMPEPNNLTAAER
jgi:hypothetical protein